MACDYDEAVLLIATHGGARVLVDEFRKGLDTWLSAADLKMDAWGCTGADLGESYKLRFVGVPATAVARAKQALAHIKNDGDGRDLYIRSPRAGDGEINIYIIADQNSEQKEVGHRWRCLKRACATLGRDDLSFDARDRLVSLDYFPILQLESDAGKDTCHIAWLRAAAVKGVTRVAHAAL